MSKITLLQLDETDRLRRGQIVSVRYGGGEQDLLMIKSIRRDGTAVVRRVRCGRWTKFQFAFRRYLNGRWYRRARRALFWLLVSVIIVATAWGILLLAARPDVSG